MIKRDEIEDPESCFNKACDDEPIFVLLARDPAAPAAIATWATERVRLGKNRAEDPQIRKALELATLMSRSRTQEAPKSAASEERFEISSRVSRTSVFTEGEVTWPQLVDQLAIQVKRGPCDLRSCLLGYCPYKERELWSPAAFSYSAEQRSSFTRVSMLVLDVDHGGERALDAARMALKPYRHLVHATHGDRPEDRCLRIVLPLSVSVPRYQWAAFWTAATRDLGLATLVDAACRDGGRFYYLPSRPKDADYCFEAIEGALYDVDRVLASRPADVTQEAAS